MRREGDVLMATATVTGQRTRVKLEKRAVQYGLPEHAVERAMRKRRKVRRAAVLRYAFLAFAAVFVIGYIGVYAQIRLYGYKKCECVKEQRELTAENLSISAEIDKLAEPERVSAIAEQNGFVAGSGIYRLGQVSSMKVAKAE